MSPEEQEITLIMQGYHLATLEFREGREQRLKHSSDGVTKAGGKVIQNKLRIV